MSEPIVVIGMHRSGTTLVAQMLEQLGVFMGVLQDNHHEALTFQRIDEDLLHIAGAQWYEPEPVMKALDDPGHRAELSADVAARLDGRRAVSYLGWPRKLRFGSIERQTGIWGWKDPRATFTLPVWRELFPDLRAVHVVRHGIDVAASLREWHGGRPEFGQRRMRLPLLRFRWRGRRVLRPKWRSLWVPGNFGFNSLDAGVELWTRYVDRGRAQVRDLGDRAIEVRFEDLARDPRAALGPLTRLCGIEPSNRQLTKFTRLVDPERAAAYQRDPELRESARRHSELLARYGY